MSRRVGIDIGSTTLKVVVLDSSGAILYKSYERHLSNVRECAVQSLTNAKDFLQGQDLQLSVTGSAGLGVATACSLPFVQEVFATAEAVREEIPGTDAVVELGGEDAKIIFLTGGLEERMNGTCAGGTGAFIDQMAMLLNVTPEQLDELSLHAEQIYPIASRCGVFAKTDIQPLLNQGAKKENIALSIFQAVVDQTIAGLAQGRKIAGKVAFLGGPLSFFKGLQQQFKKTLKLDDEHAVFHPLARYFPALGSAYLAGNEQKTFTCDELIGKLKTAVTHTDLGGIPPLFSDEAEYGAFLSRHKAASVETKDLSAYSGDAYLGIDAGSTTTKIALIDRDKNLLYTYYSSNNGDPVEVIKNQLAEIYRQCGGRVAIRSSAVTGYGEELSKNAFGCDHGLVETIAHYIAAKRFNPHVDFIIDIGGQDMKCFKIKDGTIDSVIINEACSSGCGSFIETFAKSLGYTAAEFAKLALFAKHPVNLGSRCTVFMNSSVKQAQKEGATVADISAGLSMSVVKNAVYKVIRASSAAELGENIIVQGGTFLNDAILRSFERELGANVLRPSIAGMMGAYGAAVYAMDHVPEKSALLTPEEIGEFTHTSSVVNCGLCTNKCGLTVNKFANGGTYISGNKCERPVTKNTGNPIPDMFAWKYDKLTSYKSENGTRGTVGIPLALNLYENLPFWTAFFGALSISVVLSERSSKQLYLKGQYTIPSDTACYPAKLVHGHIESLLKQGCGTIFYPCMTYNFDEKVSSNCYNCPVVAYYPELIKANVSKLQNVDFLYPHISLNDKKVFEKHIFKALKDKFPDITRKEIAKAAETGYRSYEEFKQAVKDEGAKTLAYADQHHCKVIILAGRPYHIDPEINHGINKLLNSLGFVVVTEDAVSHLMPVKDVNVLNQWTYHARLYSAANFAASRPNTEMIQLVSFGCGLDAITTDEVASLLREHGKIYTQLKIDEINNLGAVKIRVRSLLAAMEERAALEK